MARVGIDFGTTNTVVALADRGNFPVIELGRASDPRLSLPSIIAWCGDDLRIGCEAEEVWDDPSYQLLASPKRWLGVPVPEVFAGGSLAGSESAGARLESILTAFFRRLREQILACPHLEGDTALQVMIGIPANANSLQRIRTVEAARRAGLDVLGLMHEPTAAAIEYAHRHPAFGGRGKDARHIAIYDLGGGTFDASIVRVDAGGFSVIRSGGVERLGGHDFDRVMLDLALERSGVRWDDLSWTVRFRLLRRCSEAKEAIQPTTRKFIVDLDDVGGGEVTLATGEYYEGCMPLVERTVHTLEEVLGASGVASQDIDALLLVGGGSQMALVRRRLREIFGPRMKISPHPFASAAVGLAVQADRQLERPVEERFARNFGVWREADGGQRAVFDRIFSHETRLPIPGDRLVVSRTYSPAHDLGHFRFEECAELDEHEAPAGDRTSWCEVVFPFDPDLDGHDVLDATTARRTDQFGGQRITERYECDSHGIISVTIERADPWLSRSYLLYGPERVAPVIAPKRRAAAG